MPEVLCLGNFVVDVIGKPLDRLPPPGGLMLLDTLQTHACGAFVLPAMDGAPLAGLLRDARRRGIVTTLDVCWDRSGRWMETLSPCLEHVDYFLPNHPEAAALAGVDDPPEMARKFHARG